MRAHEPGLRWIGTSTIVLVLALLGAAVASVGRSQVITEFPVGIGVLPVDITAGPDGNVWFAGWSGSIGRITTSGDVTEFPGAGTIPIAITTGPDGNLWFVELFGNKVGRITTVGVITKFPIPTAGSLPNGIAAGSDGNLWFTENGGNKIGQITTAGVVTEFEIPTAQSEPRGITGGPDGNIWFTESATDRVGRIATTGVITEFVLPSAGSVPIAITTGPDGNLWFSEFDGNSIGRIDLSGVVTEFSLPTLGSAPFALALGPDGNLWFTEYSGNQIGRITTAGVITEFPIPTPASEPHGIAAGPDGNLWFTESAAIGRITTGPTTPQATTVDLHSASGTNSNANGVLEPGETVLVSPSWRNTLGTSQSFTGTASNLTGPGGPTYTINDDSADYGTVGAESSADCDSATGDCYLMTVSGPHTLVHWDARFTENLSSNSIARDWTLHVGGSFADVPTSNLFYRFVENLFHNGVTGGCSDTNYCPTNSVTRAQMAVFLMKSKLGAAEIPPPATGTVFADVPASNQFAPWIEQLAGFQITGGCGGGNYCPSNPVTRAQMAAFLLKAKHGSSYVPPACNGIFADVVCPSLFADWIEQLYAEGITGGCGGSNYCPNSPNTRGQMAAFLVKTFGLQLYGP